MEIELKVIEGRQFADEAVHLDGYEFVDCTFRNCHLVYSGGELFLFRNSPFGKDCEFEFQGPASNTMNALKLMYHIGMHDFVEHLFRIVRNPFQDSIQ